MNQTRHRFKSIFIHGSLLASMFFYNNCTGFGTPGAGIETSSSLGTIPGRIPVVGDYKVIASNFDVNSFLVPAWGTGFVHTPVTNDDVGAFRFICGPSHEAYDDPIVYPGQIGASHLHQFFGNTKANGKSTYESLRTTGDSTCGSPVNRSAYWVPAMMNGKGKVVRPDTFNIYYKRHPKSSVACTAGVYYPKGCVKIPIGLRFVFGAKMDGTGLSPNTAWFNCDSMDWKKVAPGTVPGHYSSIIEAAKNCPLGGGEYAGNKLGMVITAPTCWDGVNLDSTDHRSHMAYPAGRPDGSYGCPTTHPYGIPAFTLGAWYRVDADLYNDLKPDKTWAGTHNGWHLSSDEMNRTEPGKTVHADWFGAWDEDVLDMWTDNCVDKLFSCSGGDLGNTLQIKGANQPYPNVHFPNANGWETNPRIVDPPPMPASHKIQH